MFALQVLDNGVDVVLDSSLGVSSVTVCVSIAAGSRYERRGEPGLAHLMEHLVLAAPITALRESSVSKWVDSVGGQSNASTSHESVVFWARVPPAAAVDCARHLAAAVARPRITDELCVAETQVVVQELLAAANDPVDVAQEAFYSKLFRGSALSTPVGGSARDFPTFSAETVAKAHQRHLRTAPLNVSLVGPVELVEASCDALRDSELGAVAREVRTPVEREPVAATDISNPAESDDGSYAYLVAGGLGAGRQDRLWGATEVLTAAVGGTPGSVLYDRLRGELGVSYHVQSVHTAYRDVGVWSVIAGTAPETATLVESTVRDCLDAVSAGKLNVADFEAAKTQALGSVLLDNEDPVARAHLNCWWTSVAPPGEPPVDHVQRLIHAADHADIRAAAARVLENYAFALAC